MKTLLVLSFFITFSAMAKEEILSITSNDDNNEIYNLVVNVDDTTQSLKELFKDTYINGKKIKRDVLDAKKLTTSEGVVLERRDKYNVLNLKSTNFDYDRGGRIVIDTLYNGINGERKTYEVELAKSPTGWKLFKANKIVSTFQVKVNKMLVVVGIKTIVMK